MECLSCHNDSDSALSLSTKSTPVVLDTTLILYVIHYSYNWLLLHIDCLKFPWILDSSKLTHQIGILKFLLTALATWHVEGFAPCTKCFIGLRNFTNTLCSYHNLLVPTTLCASQIETQHACLLFKPVDCSTYNVISAMSLHCIPSHNYQQLSLINWLHVTTC